MAKVSSHRELIVWQKAMDMAVAVYEIGDRFPRKETYGLTSQITRAAASVPANIAEGSARGTARDYSNFLAIAKGSLVETETYLLLAIRLCYISEADARAALDLMTQVSKMLTAMRTGLDKRAGASTRL